MKFKNKKTVSAWIVSFVFILVASLTVLVVKSNKSICLGKPRNINVAYSADKNYIFPTLVSMTSLMENLNKNTFCKFTILLSEGTTETDKENLRKIQKRYSNCTVNCIDMGKQFENSEVGFWSRATYYRLSLPQILKEENRCIYLDGDTIVRGDLSCMNDIDMSNYYIAGVKDINCYINKDSNYYEVLEIPNLDSYVCAGVLIMNLDKIHKDGIDVTLDRLIKENDLNKKFKFLDQDALNKACYGGILKLPFKYGALAHVGLDQEFVESEYAQWASNEKDWEEGRKNPLVLHYTGVKPWVKIIDGFYQQWWDYANMTDCKEEIQTKYPLS